MALKVLGSGTSVWTDSCLWPNLDNVDDHQVLYLELRNDAMSKTVCNVANFLLHTNRVSSTA
jgi:hypothetical protein